MKPKFFYMRETGWQSVLTDMLSLLMVCFVMFINYHYLSGSHIWTVMLLVLTFGVIVTRHKALRFGSEQELMAYLDPTTPVIFVKTVDGAIDKLEIYSNSNRFPKEFHVLDFKDGRYQVQVMKPVTVLPLTELF